MTTTQDCSVGIANESTYGTGVTVTRWFEFVDESFDYNKNVKQGQGLRVASRVARSGRRVVATSDAAGDNPTPVTLQKGVVEAGLTVDAYTFAGGMVDSWELAFPNADVPSLKVSMDFKSLTTATAYASPSYSTSPTLYSFSGGSLASGTLTAPTSTALASGTTTVANVRGGSLKVDNNLAKDRFNIGASGQKAKPTVGLRSITGSLEVEYDATTYRDAILNDSSLMLILNFTGAALSTGNETLQVVLPAVYLNGELPKANGADLITQNLSFDVLDNLTAAQPIWVVARTSDSAL